MVSIEKKITSLIFSAIMTVIRFPKHSGPSGLGHAKEGLIFIIWYVIDIIHGVNACMSFPETIMTWKFYYIIVIPGDISVIRFS